LTSISAEEPAAICPDAGVTLNGMYEASSMFSVPLTDVVGSTAGGMGAASAARCAGNGDSSSSMIAGVPVYRLLTVPDRGLIASERGLTPSGRSWSIGRSAEPTAIADDPAIILLGTGVGTVGVLGGGGATTVGMGAPVMMAMADC